ncbi:hypothetical protein SAMN06298216_3692 [Spirosomataceae bacterium TFI 002]|nr:hypothetical protein SAMN06298216_3692 [Spirosomataceae bacterium TFI 002]
MNSFLKISDKDRSALVRALELILEDEWDEAHEIAQEKEGDPAYDRVHALLHRIEGDEFNANYWYRRVGVKLPNYSTEKETQELFDFLMDRS